MTTFGDPDAPGGASFSASQEYDLAGDSDLRAHIKGELDPGERLLWAARAIPIPNPPGCAYYGWGAIALALTAVAGGLFVRGWHRRWFDDGSPTMGGLICFGIACFIMALIVFNLFNHRDQERRKAKFLYAITDRRAIIWTPEPKKKGVRLRTLVRGQIANLERVQRPDGSGDLYFTGRSHAAPVEEFGWTAFAFTNVHEVRRVEQIVRNNLIAFEQPT
jgi:hypothetical protein